MKLKTKCKLFKHYTGDIAWKRVTSGGAHLRGLAPGQNSSKKTTQQCRWRCWRHCVRFVGPGIEPQTSYTTAMSLTATPTVELDANYDSLFTSTIAVSH